MFQLTIQTGNQAWTFLFKDKAKAEAARDAARSLSEVHSHSMSAALGGRSCKVTDDFGRDGEFSAVTAVVYEDLDQSMFANIAMSIHQAHVQIKANDMARNDPILKARAAMGGPAIVSPMGMNGAGFGRA